MESGFSHLRLGGGFEGQGGPAVRGIAREGFFYSRNRNRSQVMANMTDKVKGEIHAAAENVKDAAQKIKSAKKSHKSV